MDYFLAIKVALALLVNDPIMLGRLIQLFWLLECQNPSIILDSRDWAGWCNNSRGEQGAGRAGVVGGI